MVQTYNDLPTNSSRSTPRPLLIPRPRMCGLLLPVVDASRSQPGLLSLGLLLVSGDLNLLPVVEAPLSRPGLLSLGLLLVSGDLDLLPVVEAPLSRPGLLSLGLLLVSGDLDLLPVVEAALSRPGLLSLGLLLVSGDLDLQPVVEAVEAALSRLGLAGDRALVVSSSTCPLPGGILTGDLDLVFLKVEVGLLFPRPTGLFCLGAGD